MKLFLRRTYRLIGGSRDAAYLKKLEEELNEADSVLDLGCGSKSPLRYLNKKIFSIGVGLAPESIKRSKELKIHDRYYLMDVLDIDKVFSPKSFDAVLALDLIEHLPKQKGRLLIDKMEKVARKKVIIFTPNGFVEQQVKGLPLQRHKSGWAYTEMRELGYKCLGTHGIKFIKRNQGNITQRPKIFWEPVADVSQKFVCHIPPLAFQLFCVKNL